MNLRVALLVTHYITTRISGMIVLFLLGTMCNNIQIGSYAYRYLCNTSSRTDLNYLQGVDGAIGRCFTLITENGERTFAISPGQMNQLQPESIPEDVIADASALVLTAYLVRCKTGESQCRWQL